ncbi:MAG: DMT family transporter [Negativicutes bacterium]|nr:DMT family transporter [Negativicutes bacterium]
MKLITVIAPSAALLAMAVTGEGMTNDHRNFTERGEMNAVCRGALYLSLAASIWGGTYVASKYALDAVPPFTLLFIRYALAGIVLVWLCRRQGIAIVPAHAKGIMFLIGFAGYFLSIAAQFIGTKLSSAHLGAVITTLSPIFQSLFAIVILQEKLSLKQALATAVSFSGVFVIVGLPDSSDTAVPLAGSVFLLLASLFWGYYSVLSRKASASFPPLQITAWGILVATALALPTVFWEWGEWQATALYSGTMLFSIFYLSVISTAVAYLYWNKGLALVPSHEAGLFFFLQPLVGSLLGWLLLGETLTVSFLCGSLLVIAGVYWAMR